MLARIFCFKFVVTKQKDGIIVLAGILGYICSFVGELVYIFGIYRENQDSLDNVGCGYGLEK